MKATKFKLAAIFLAIFFFAGLISCNKKTDETSQNNVQRAAIDEKDFKETDEDLMNVDYKQFYDELAPHGEWIEVTDKDIGINLKNGSASGEFPHRTISVSELFGVKDAVAADVSIGAFFVWKPSPDMAVSVVAGEPEPYYVPYTNGQWMNTDAGWYFAAPTPYEEVVHHYGRWVYSPALGWVWMPGRVWAPAWVDWREDDQYIAWAPVPPSVYLVSNAIIVPPLPFESYVVVEKRYFVEPVIYRYIYTSNPVTIVTNMTPIPGVMVVNNMVIDQGPQVTVIESVRGSKIEMIKINKVGDIKEVRVSSGQVNTFTPKFYRVETKGKSNTSFVKPVKYDSYENVKSKSKDKQESSGQQKDIKGNSKGSDVKGKGNDKGIKGPNKLGDDSQMKTGKYKGTEKSGQYDKGNNKGGQYDKGKNKGGQNDKGKNKGGQYDKGTNKGGQNDKGTNKGGQNDKGKSNDKGGKKKFSNDKGSNNGQYGKGTNKGGQYDKGNNKGGKKNFSRDMNYRQNNDKGNNRNGEYKSNGNEKSFGNKNNSDKPKGNNGKSKGKR